MENALIFLNRLNVNPYPNYSIFMFLFSFSFFLKDNFVQQFEPTDWNYASKKKPREFKLYEKVKFFCNFLEHSKFSCNLSSDLKLLARKNFFFRFFFTYELYYEKF